MAERNQWADVQFRRACWVRGGEDVWRRFIANGSVADLAEMVEAFEALALSDVGVL